MKNRIILIAGPKCSGKSMCARALGKLIGAESVDLDEIVEDLTGKTPRVLYKEGPEIFRKAEVLALASQIRSTEHDVPVEPGDASRRGQRIQIIAAGGGLIDNPEALALLFGHSEIITVYLDVSPETAWDRITLADAELPPFLNTENPKETHLALHKRRAEAYKAFAGLTVSAENKSPQEIAGEIARSLHKPN